jgi:hypothetical protein
MNIKIEEPYRPTELFGNLSEGQTFLYEGGLFMKVHPCGVSNVVCLNVVCLRDGRTLVCKPDIKVYPVNCDVTVRGIYE